MSAKMYDCYHSKLRYYLVFMWVKILLKEILALKNTSPVSCTKVEKKRGGIRGREAIRNSAHSLRGMKIWWIIGIKQSLLQTPPILAKNPHCCWITGFVGQRCEKTEQRSLKNRCSSWHPLLSAAWQYPHKTSRKTDKFSPAICWRLGPQITVWWSLSLAFSFGTT